MSVRFTFKKTLLAISGAILVGSLAQAAPAEARHRDGRGGHDRRAVVHRYEVHRPVVRRVVVVERPYYPRVRRGYGWRHHVDYRPGRRRGWRDRPRCWLPERYLCR